MSASLLFALVSNLLAVVFTLSVLLLVLFWQQWRTSTGRALLQLVSSLALLQGATLLIATGLWTDASESVLKALLSLIVIGFFLVISTSLALLLRAAQAMKEAWPLLCRSGIAALVVLQPAIWKHGLFVLNSPLDATMLDSAYTPLGKVLASICVVYLMMVIYVGWHYWRQIDTPLMAGPVLGLAILQTITLSTGTLHGLALTGAFGGIVSLLLAYYLVREFQIAPQEAHVGWVSAIHDASQAFTSDLSLDTALAGVAEHARRLARTDVISVLLAIGPDRLEVVACTTCTTPIVGRQVRIGEGLAGRVMQTVQAMRVENYRQWDGRAADFNDMPYHASLSIPLIHEGQVVGVIDAHETKPGRVFSDRDQVVLELFAPYATILIMKARLENELSAARAYFQAVISHTTAAMLVFDSTGSLLETNPIAQNYLRLVFHEAHTPPTIIELAARAQDSAFTEALVRWTAEPMSVHTFETLYQPIGRLTIQLQPVPTGSLRDTDLMVIMQALNHNTSEPDTIF
ncbi:MAG: GAF domain-containing protein [Chloroflexi bacterium]|nr:GAF domain-containing protein [Chloroflexota bacterium]